MKLVTIICDGVTDVHLPHPDGTYATLCGMDGDDYDDTGVFGGAVDQRTVKTPRGAKVSCRKCWDIWSHASQFTVGVFSDNAKT